MNKIILLLFTLTFTFCYSDKVKFVFDPLMYRLKSGEIKEVSIAGSFNNWMINANILKKSPDGKYYIELDLPEGIHYYKFVVNGKIWLEDALADKSLRKDDGYGGYNSGVIVGETGKMYGEAKSNEIVDRALLHTQEKREYYNTAFEEIIILKLRTLETDVEKVNVLFFDKENKIVKTFLMNHTYSQVGFDYFSLITYIPDNAVEYCFELQDGKKIIYFGKEGSVENKHEVVKFPIVRYKSYVPLWSRGIVWYQIMLDRFYDGVKDNNKETVLPWQWNVLELHPTEKKKYWDVVWNREYGGDFQGLISKLPYLEDLGVEGLYLTPVFKAKTYHKYDTIDYRHIDDHFGYKGDYAEIVKTETEDMKTWKFTSTDKLFLQFLSEAKRRNIRVIIDGVFNHSGEDFWAFKDLKTKFERSKYKDWYVITDWSVFRKEAHLGKGYQGWWGFGGLPEYKEDEKGLVPGIRKHIFDITRRWMDPDGNLETDDGIDGWRLDVPDCVAYPFWVDWCKLVKKINLNSYIVGELWDEKPGWISEGMFDAQMNYPLAKTIVKFFIDRSISVTEFDKELDRLMSIYPLENVFVMLNCIDSHDTDRLVSMIENPYRSFDKKNRRYEKDGEYNPGYKYEKPSKSSYEKLKLIEIFRFTYIGSPCIWYGTEVGMWGADDPDNRKPMLWEELQPYNEPGSVVDKELFEYYKKLIAIRNTFSPLKTGLKKTVLCDDEKNVYAYLRNDKKDVVLIVINNSDKHQKVKLFLQDTGKHFSDILSEKVKIENKKVVFKPSKVYKFDKPVTITLKPNSGKIFVPVEK